MFILEKFEQIFSNKSIRGKIVNFIEFGLFSLLSFFTSIFLSFYISKDNYSIFGIFQSLNNLFSAIISVSFVDAIIYKNKNNFFFQISKKDFGVYSLISVFQILTAFFVLKNIVSDYTILSLMIVSLVVYQNIYYYRRKNLILDKQYLSVILSALGFGITLIILLIWPEKYYWTFFIIGIFPFINLLLDVDFMSNESNEINYFHYFFSSILFWIPINSMPLLFYYFSSSTESALFRYTLNILSPFHQISSALCAFYYVRLLKAKNSSERVKMFLSILKGKEILILSLLSFIFVIPGYFYVSKLQAIELKKYMTLHFSMCIYILIPFFNNYYKAENKIYNSLKGYICSILIGCGFGYLFNSVTLLFVVCNCCLIVYFFVDLFMYSDENKNI